MVIILAFFTALGLLIAGATLKKEKKQRVGFAISAFILSCFMYNLAGWANSLNYNIWYSGATNKLLLTSIEALEKENEGQLLEELKKLQDQLVVTYETKGDYPDLVLKAVERLQTKAEQVDADNPDNPPENSKNQLDD